MKSKQIIVSGLVQGVGYRKYARLKAIEQKIVGWARNLRTTQVEILAQCEEAEDLQQFVEQLKVGPPRSKVEKVEIIDVDSLLPSCDTFTIEPDGERQSDFS